MLEKSQGKIRRLFHHISIDFSLPISLSKNHEYPKAKCLFSIFFHCIPLSWKLSWTIIAHLLKSLVGPLGERRRLCLWLSTPLPLLLEPTQAFQENSQPPLPMLFKNHLLGTWEKEWTSFFFFFLRNRKGMLLIKKYQLNQLGKRIVH